MPCLLTIAKSIKGFYRYRSAHFAAGTRNPWNSILADLRVPEGPMPHRQPAWKLFSSVEAARVTAACPPGSDIGVRNAKAQALFAQEPEDERLRYEEEAKANYLRAVEVYNDAHEGVPSVDPAEQEK